MRTFGEGVFTSEIAIHQVEDRGVQVAGICAELVERGSQVIKSAVIGEKETQQGFGFELRGCRWGGDPLRECLAALFGDLVEIAGTFADLFFAGGGMAESDEFLLFVVEESFRFGPGVPETAGCLSGEVVAGPWSQGE